MTFLTAIEALRRDLARVFLLALLASLLAALPGAPPASARPATLPDGVEIEVVSVERLGHSTQLLLELRNPEDESLISELSDPAYGRSDDIKHNDLSGIHLLDEAEDIEYAPYRETEEKLCICSHLGNLDEDTTDTWTLWWRSAPLPDSVESVSVIGPEGDVLASDVEVTG